MKTEQTLFRSPETLAAEVRATFAALTSRASKECVNFSHRLVRREHLTIKELQEISALITADPDSTTAKILGSSATIAWIETCLNPS